MEALLSFLEDFLKSLRGADEETRFIVMKLLDKRRSLSLPLLQLPKNPPITSKAIVKNAQFHEKSCFGKN